MTILDVISAALILTGAVFFLAGTVGLLRFPDVYTRIHALTKADNLGLGLVVLGLLFQVESFSEALKLLVIWGLVLAAGATAANLVAGSALENGIRPWRRR
jgi:multicomponent Na+:H+ antiporter subunit G